MRTAKLRPSLREKKSHKLKKLSSLPKFKRSFRLTVNGTVLQPVSISELKDLFDIYSKIPVEWSSFNRLPFITSVGQLAKERLKFFFVKNNKNETKGACGIHIDRRRKRMLIARIFVLPDVQRQGHGKNLMNALFEIGRKTGCRKAYGFVSAVDHPMALNELNLMLSLGCRKASDKPVQFSNGLFWLIEKDLM